MVYLAAAFAVLQNLSGPDPCPQRTVPFTVVDGNAAVVHYLTTSTGRLAVSVRSADFEPVLRIEDRGGELLASDPEGAFLWTGVDAGTEIVVQVDSRTADAGSGTLLLKEAPETEETRVAARAVAALRSRLQAAQRAGDGKAAAALLQQALDQLQSVPGGHCSFAIQDARWEMGRLAFDLGAFGVAADSWSMVHDFRRRFYPPRHPLLLESESFLGTAQLRAGRLAAARMHLAAVLEVYRGTLTATDPQRLQIQLNLADTLHRLGLRHEAKELQQEVVTLVQHQESPDLGFLQMARVNLANTLIALDDRLRARIILDASIRALEDTVAEDHPHLQAARITLGALSLESGDFVAARALFEQVLQVQEEVLPDDHPDLLRTRDRLAVTLLHLGDVEAARELLEVALGDRSGPAVEDPPEVLAAWHNLANVLAELWEEESSLVLRQQILDVYEASAASPDHPRRLAARHSLADAHGRSGDLVAARQLLEELLDPAESAFADSYSGLLEARADYAWVLAGLGDHQGVERECRRLARGLQERLRDGVILSLREAQAMVDHGSVALSAVLSLQPHADQATLRRHFELVELLRSVATGQRTLFAAKPSSPPLRARREEVVGLRARVNDLSLAIQESSTAGAAAALDLAAAVRARDRAEAMLRQQMVADGLAGVRSDAAAIAAALDEDAAAVSYLVYDRGEVQRQRFPVERRPSLLALVLGPDGALRRVELGPLDAAEAAVQQWRDALLDQHQPPVHARSLGEWLRELVLDPVLAAVGPANTLHLCLDGPLHLVPFEALPTAAARVGDEHALFMETSLSHLLRSPPRHRGAGQALILGGVDYNAGAGGPAAEGDQPFWPLPGSSREAAAIQQVFVRVDAPDPVLLTARRATKQALVDQAASARYLHVATHGYFLDHFAPPDSGSAGPGPLRWLGAGEAVARLAPWTLCGLALAGANQGRGEPGDLDTIITAEEIAGLDLSRCELAVLSACETGLGERSSGRVVHSLQSALQAAGARATVTSLWKVDDRATTLLMNRFYENLLGAHGDPREGRRRTYDPTMPMPRAAALWEAKVWLRGLSSAAARAACRQLGLDPEEQTRGGAPMVPGEIRRTAVDQPGPYARPSYWAAFVLIGDPSVEESTEHQEN